MILAAVRRDLLCEIGWGRGPRSRRSGPRHAGPAPPGPLIANSLEPHATCRSAREPDPHRSELFTGLETVPQALTRLRTERGAPRRTRCVAYRALQGELAGSQAGRAHSIGPGSRTTTPEGRPNGNDTNTVVFVDSTPGAVAVVVAVDSAATGAAAVTVVAVGVVVAGTV